MCMYVTGCPLWYAHGRGHQPDQRERSARDLFSQLRGISAHVTHAVSVLALLGTFRPEFNLDS